MFAGYRHCKKCGKALMGLFDGALCEECEKEENRQIAERCINCRFFHRLKHNFERGKGFEESHCCTIMLEHDFEPSVKNIWVQEVDENSRCEMFTKKETFIGTKEKILHEIAISLAVIADMMTDKAESEG